MTTRGLILPLVATITFAGATGNTAPATTRYFPQGIFSPHPAKDEFEARGPSSVLFSLHEVPLVPGAVGMATYRLTNVTDGYVIRVEKKHGENPVLVHKRIRNFESAQVPVQIETSKGEVSFAGWQALEQLVAEASFWSLPNFEEFGIDGTTLFLEGLRDDGTYHAVRRWSPQGGSFARVWRRLRALAQPNSPLPGASKVSPLADASDKLGSIWGQVIAENPSSLRIRAGIEGGGIEETRRGDGVGSFSFKNLHPGFYEIELHVDDVSDLEPEARYFPARYLIRVREGARTCVTFRRVEADEGDQLTNWGISVGCGTEGRAYGP